MEESVLNSNFSILISQHSLLNFPYLFSIFNFNFSLYYYMNTSYRTSSDERAYEFGKSVVLFIRPLWKTYEGRIIAQQLMRSATSIGANITEGQDSSSRRQLSQYLQIALRSARETRFWLRLAHETGYEQGNTTSELQREVGELIGILVASVKKLKGMNNQ